MNNKTIRDIDVQDKKVLVRVDFNVPMEGGRILDDTRMTEALPTLKYLLERGAKVILVTHFGRPKGKVVPEMSTRQLVPHLSSLLGQEVLFAKDCGGESSLEVVGRMKPGQAALLENSRFLPGEEKNDPEMARNLARLAEIYVNDAFGSAHRAHASTEGVAKYLPGVAGFLMEKELEALSSVLDNPSRPFVAILGGAKVSDKITVMENLLPKVNAMLIGGGMANTFLKSMGYDVGKSLVEEDKVELAGDILLKAVELGVEVLLPQDVVVADRFAADAEAKTVRTGDVPAGWMILDMGPQSVELYQNKIKEAKTVIWNGPLGVYEFDKFAQGTLGVVRAVAASSAKTVIGGGDVVAALEKTGLADKIFHISTGGGASLEFLEGKVLPGVAALQGK